MRTLLCFLLIWALPVLPTDWNHNLSGFDPSGQVNLRTLAGATNQLSNSGQLGLQSSASPTVLSVTVGETRFEFVDAVTVSHQRADGTTLQLVVLSRGDGSFKTVAKSVFDAQFQYQTLGAQRFTFNSISTSYRWGGINNCSQSMDPVTTWLPYFKVDVTCDQMTIKPAGFADSELTEFTYAFNNAFRVVYPIGSSVFPNGEGEGRIHARAKLKSEVNDWGFNSFGMYAVQRINGETTNASAMLSLPTYFYSFDTSKPIWSITFPTTGNGMPYGGTQYNYADVYSGSFVMFGPHAFRIPFEYSFVTGAYGQVFPFIMTTNMYLLVNVLPK